MPGTVLGSGDTTMNKIASLPTRGLCSSHEGRQQMCNMYIRKFQEHAVIKMKRWMFSSNSRVGCLSRQNHWSCDRHDEQSTSPGFGD